MALRDDFKYLESIKIIKNNIDFLNLKEEIDINKNLISNPSHIYSGMDFDKEDEFEDFGLNTEIFLKPFFYIEAPKEEYEHLYFAFRDLDSMISFLGQFLEKHVFEYEVSVSDLVEKIQEIEAQENENLFLAFRFLDNCVVTSIVDTTYKEISGCKIVFDLD